jgi:hypothetical protein
MLNSANVTDRREQGLITEDDILRSYDLIALISACQVAIDQCSGLTEELSIQALGNVARVLRLAGEIAGQSHDLIERAHARQATAQSGARR